MLPCRLEYNWEFRCFLAQGCKIWTQVRNIWLTHRYKFISLHASQYQLPFRALTKVDTYTFSFFQWSDDTNPTIHLLFLLAGSYVINLLSCGREDYPISRSNCSLSRTLKRYRHLPLGNTRWYIGWRMMCEGMLTRISLWLMSWAHHSN